MSFDRILGVTRSVFRYDNHVSIAEKYHELRGEWPIIIEAEDLCQDSKGTIESFCRQAKIPFLEKALFWEKGMPDQWKHFGDWHKDAAESRFFHILERDQQKTRFANVPIEYIEQLEEVYQTQKPYYEKLRKIKQMSLDEN